MTPIALILLATIAVTVGYVLLCFISPFGPCRRCEGSGNHVSRWDRHTSAGNRPRKRRIRKPCRRCKGTGARLRIGRRVHNHARKLHADGTN